MRKSPAMLDFFDSLKKDFPWGSLSFFAPALKIPIMGLKLLYNAIIKRQRKKRPAKATKNAGPGAHRQAAWKGASAYGLHHQAGRRARGGVQQHGGVPVFGRQHPRGHGRAGGLRRPFCSCAYPHGQTISYSQSRMQGSPTI